MRNAAGLQRLKPYNSPFAPERAVPPSKDALKSHSIQQFYCLNMLRKTGFEKGAALRLCGKTPCFERARL